MAQKRRQESGDDLSDGSSLDQEQWRSFSCMRNGQEGIKSQPVKNWLESVVEPLIRRVVREEIEIALRKHLTDAKGNSEEEMDCSETRKLELKFLNNLSVPMFTGGRIEGAACLAIKVGLFDSETGEIVTLGPESSAKVEMVVLEGHSENNEKDNWTHDEFQNNIVRERDGKKAILSGDPFLVLDKGIGIMNELSFTDNSSWTRSRKFRLGARMVDTFNGISVKAGKTSSFVVKDHRGELYKKHHPPCLTDEVWRLEKIGKDGAFHKRLSREYITTVKDFLTVLSIDPPRLRKILGNGMSARMWDITVEHAETCTLDKTMSVYYLPGSQQKSGVVFNVVGQLKGVISQCQFVPVDKLSGTEKAAAQKYVLSSFRNRDGVVSYFDEKSLMSSFPPLTNNGHCTSSLTKTMASASNGPCTSSSTKTMANASNVLASHKIGGFDHTQPSASPADMISSTYSIGDMRNPDDYTLHSIENMGLKFDQMVSYPGSGRFTSPIFYDEFMTPSFFADMSFFNTDSSLHNVFDLESHCNLQSAADSFQLQRTTAAVTEAQRRWKKLSSIVKWFCIRKLVASKRTRGH